MQEELVDLISHLLTELRSIRQELIKIEEAIRDTAVSRATSN